MASSLTKSALKSLENSRTVAASARTSSQLVAAELDTLYGRVLREGETMPDWIFIQELNARLLEDSAGQVTLADQKHRDEQVQSASVREDRDALTKAVQQRIRDARQSVAGTHGKTRLKLVGLDEPPARKPLAVYRQAGHIVEKLREDDLDLGPANSGLSPVEPISVAGEMETDVNALGEVLTDLDRELKESTEAQVAKTEALKVHRRRYVNVARSQESYCRLADLDELADRIRPFGRRTGRGTQKSEATENEEPTATPPPRPPDASA